MNQSSFISVEQNVSLQPFNTFGIDVKAKAWTEVSTSNQMKKALEESLQHENTLILGGGSNVLFLEDYDGLIIKNNIRGIEKVRETKQHVWLKVGAGENWHDFVLSALEKNYGGIENLSLIPGTVGAAPMQNIGAYGVEVCQVIEEVEVIDRKTLELKTITNRNCNFGYRSSIFKHRAKDKYVITGVVFRLTKENHQLNTSYGAIHNTLQKDYPSIQEISQAVIQIRQSKLPDPKEIGNGGSFFKNPEIPEDQFEKLKEKYPDIVGYPTNPNQVKVPAGWLIEQCGWKGKVIGNTGSHAQQALVLVNYGKASGKEIWNLACAIQKSVKEKFGIQIVPEVNIVSNLK